MSYRYLRLYAAVCLLLDASLLAQPNVIASLRGELHRGQDVLFQGYVIELDQGNGRDPIRADVSTTGAFEFRNLPSGNYILRVTNLEGARIQEEFLSVHPNLSTLDVHLRDAGAARPPSGPVTVRQLRHPPSRKAVAAVVAAQKYSQANRYDRAAAELEKAIRLSPDYAPAHTNLAAQYLRLGRPQDALQQCRDALEIAGPNAMDLSNLALTQAALHRYPEALQSARRALELEPDDPAANYIAGALLSSDPRMLPQAAAHLERAAASLPAAEQALRKVQAAIRQSAFR